jgi:hypothetical protein
LRELEMSGRRYTWANSLLNPTYEKLDRVLISTEWELSHPLYTVVAMPKDISDHTLLFIDTGTASSSNNQPMFKFELGWLLRDGFMEMVKNVWDSVKDGEDSMRCWQSKIRQDCVSILEDERKTLVEEIKRRRTCWTDLITWTKRRNQHYSLLWSWI